MQESESGPSRHFAARRKLVAIRAQRTLASRTPLDLWVHGLATVLRPFLDLIEVAMAAMRGSLVSSLEWLNRGWFALWRQATLLDLSFFSADLSWVSSV
jgi:hypothetical protein